MSAIERYRRILSVLLPAGALGMSILLGSTGAEAAREAPTGAQPPDGAPGRIAERLSAVRDAVSEITGIEDKAAAPLEGTDKLAWGNWANFGKGNWGNWKNKWKNWKNNWGNGWNNWPNGWNNGWRNY